MATVPTAEIRRYLMRKAATKGVPISGVFELTPRCNLRCKMCYVRLAPEQMAPLGRERTAAEWLSLGRQAADAGMAFLLLTGGEPTLRSDFSEIYEGLAGLGLVISINTNGTRITDEIKALWHRLPPAQVNITLYGTSRADYQALCADPGAFDAMEDGLDWLKKEGIFVNLNATMHTENAHKWQELERYAKARGVGIRMTAYCFPPHRRSHCDDCGRSFRLSPEDAGELLAREVLFRTGEEGIRSRAAALELPIRSDCGQELGEPMHCLAGRSQFWVDWNGDTVPCGMLPEPVVHPFEKGFLNEWEALRRASGQIRLCPECSTCPDEKSCMNCAAVTYSETGRFDGKPEYMCRMNRAYRDAVLRLAEEL